jgi:hypothetical protein
MPRIRNFRCSAGRKKWRHGAYLGMLPAPIGGESDITRIYIAKYGEPEPGKKVFIRTRQQRNGWEDEAKDTSEVVPAKAVVTARPRRAGGVVPGRRAGRMQPRCTRGLRRASAGAPRGQHRWGKVYSRGLGRAGRGRRAQGPQRVHAAAGAKALNARSGDIVPGL